MSFLAWLFTKKNLPKPKGYLAAADKQEISDRWGTIEELAALNKPSTLRQAVIEADKLIDFALNKLYPNRQGSAERLKEAREYFKQNRQTYENLWYAHKIRNEMVHTVGFELPIVEAKNIIGFFKEALNQIGGL